MISIDAGHVLGIVLAGILVSGIGGAIAAYVAMRIHVAVDENRQTQLLKWISTVDDRLNRHATKLENMHGHEQRLERIEGVLNGRLTGKH